MPDLSPSETLRAAAEKLREAAAATSTPLWARQSDSGRLAWLLLIPDVAAAALAAWLDEEVHALEELTPSHIPSPAVAFARCLLEGQDG